jgi:hypothetical protein
VLNSVFISIARQRRARIYADERARAARIIAKILRNAYSNPIGLIDARKCSDFHSGTLVRLYERRHSSMYPTQYIQGFRSSALPRWR